MTDPIINYLHDFLWVLIDTLIGLLRIAPYVAVFSILSLVFTGLAIAINRQREEHQKQDEGRHSSRDE
jgi:hypothetical protein